MFSNFLLNYCNFIASVCVQLKVLIKMYEVKEATIVRSPYLNFRKRKRKDMDLDLPNVIKTTGLKLHYGNFKNYFLVNKIYLFLSFYTSITII